MSIRFTRQARRDILDIWYVIAASSIEAADQFTAHIETGCRRLTEFPEMGPKRVDIGPDVRVLIISRWLIVYRIIAGGVQIVRVVDGARDLTRLPQPRD